MNKYEEAFAFINEVECSQCPTGKKGDNFCNKCQTRRSLINLGELVERASPKSFNLTNNYHSCPNCERILGYVSFCPYCGQAVK